MQLVQYFLYIIFRFTNGITSRRNTSSVQSSETVAGVLLFLTKRCVGTDLFLQFKRESIYDNNLINTKL